MRQKHKNRQAINYEAFFQVGVSPDYILIREDFPVGSIPPGEFSQLIQAMFRKNDEVLDAKE